MALNRRGDVVATMKPETRELLRSRYAADIVLTEALTGLNLSAWRSSPASSAAPDRVAA